MAVTSSVLNLMSISVERFFAIVFPLKKQKTPLVTVIVVCINWLISIGMALPHLIVRRTFEYYWADRHEVWCDEVWPKIYTDTDCHTKMPGRVVYYTIVCVVMYFIPILVMVCAYTIIVIKMVMRKRPGTFVTTYRQVQDKSRRKVWSHPNINIVKHTKQRYWEAKGKHFYLLLFIQEFTILPYPNIFKSEKHQ